ncbi:MAG: radical SAM protein [Burkholderiaceae bacterium]|nr:radical SAM protein [Burkholderiaceae bacterium]
MKPILSDATAAPAWVVIQLLEECNLRCRMCYEWGEAGSYHALDKLAQLDLELVLRTVRECLPHRPSFEFFGGEPMLYPGIWEVIRAIREGGCELAFPTNGTLLEAHAARLVEQGPTRLWVSLDGPAEINDRQRGRGVFKRVMRGLQALEAAKRTAGSRYPELGITYVVTPSNADHVADFFLRGIDLSLLSCVSIELQSYATREQAQAYGQALSTHFGVASTPCANGYVRDPAIFSGIDMEALTAQLVEVSAACAQRGILFHSQPQTLEVENIRNYFSARWQAMIDRRSRCAIPWITAEISARGEVTTCHTFNDLPVGNIHEHSLLDIWRGERLKQLRGYLREQLFPICTACCRYWGGAGALPAPRKRDA